MTINIGLVTDDALVLGCDSVASATMPLLDPFSLKLTRSENSQFRVDFDLQDLQPVVFEVWGGVTKMFSLSSDPPVAATTSGLAKLNSRTMSNLAEEFEDAQRNVKRVNVWAIANDFYRFMRQHFEKHYQDSRSPEELWEGPEFLVGGVGRDDAHPSLYRVRTKEKSVEEAVNEEFAPGNSGISWAGQADTVERLIRGYDSLLRTQVQDALEEALKVQHASLSQAMAQNLQAVVDHWQGQVPEDLELPLPPQHAVELPWDVGNVSIDYANLPLQSAVDLTAFLVNMQSGKSKFQRGVGTVGGRTHIGVITRGRSLRKLNEPDLAHKNVGFSDDV